MCVCFFMRRIILPTQPRPQPRHKRYVNDVASVFTQTQLRLHFNRIVNEFNAFYSTEVR